MELTDRSLSKDRCYVDGEWIGADSGKTIDVRDPATG
jgi:succinate-semialdehyde dehydrogenase/glutarate-semialdehyde dehydrogenase